MPVLSDSPECADLRVDMKGDRLNIQLLHIHENKSVKAHWVVLEESVIIQDKCHYLNKY